MYSTIEKAEDLAYVTLPNNLNRLILLHLTFGKILIPDIFYYIMMTRKGKIRRNSTLLGQYNCMVITTRQKVIILSDS